MTEKIAMFLSVIYYGEHFVLGVAGVYLNPCTADSALRLCTDYIVLPTKTTRSRRSTRKGMCLL